MDAPPDDRPRPRLKIGLGAAVVLVLLALVAAVLVSALAPRGSTQILAPGIADSRASDAGPSGAQARDAAGSKRPGAGGHDADASDAELPGILVHVLGAVSKPGLYELHEGDRVIDAVAAAGGYTDAADRARLNLARAVTDGEQLYAPALGEIPPGAASRGAGLGAGAAGSGGAAVVNLNTADSTQLETLPRVGPETAKKIIEYRESTGAFSSVDDLLNVPGIGRKTLEGLRDSATV